MSKEQSQLEKERSECADERTSVLSKLARREKDEGQKCSNEFHEKRNAIIEKHGKVNDASEIRKKADKTKTGEAQARAADGEAKAKQKNKNKNK